MTFARNALTTFGSTLLITPIRLATFVVLARFLTPEDFGRLTITVTFASIAMLTFQLGLPSVAIYLLRRHRDPRNEVVGAMLLVVLIVCSIASIVLIALEPYFLPTFFLGASATTYQIGVAIAMLQLIAAVFVGIARGIDRFDLANMYPVSVAIAQLTGLGVMLGVFHGTVIHALATIAFVAFATSVGLVAVVVHICGVSFSHWRRKLAPGMRYGLKSYIQAMSASLHEQGDILILAHLLPNPAQIAAYSVAVGVVTRLKLIPSALADALLPEVAGRSTEDGAALTGRAIRHATHGVSVIAAGIALLSGPVVPLAFGESYLDSVRVLLILLPGMICLTIFLLLSRFFMGINRQQVPAALQVIALGLNVTLNFLLIPNFGILGAAFASTLSYSLESIAIVLIFTRVTEQRLASIIGFTRGDWAYYANQMQQAWHRTTGK